MPPRKPIDENGSKLLELLNHLQVNIHYTLEARLHIHLPNDPSLVPGVLTAAAAALNASPGPFSLYRHGGRVAVSVRDDPLTPFRFRSGGWSYRPSKGEGGLYVHDLSILLPPYLPGAHGAEITLGNPVLTPYDARAEADAREAERRALELARRQRLADSARKL